MPTTKPQKSTNLDLPDWERAQRCAAIITRQSRETLQDPKHPEYPIKRAIARGLEMLEASLTEPRSTTLPARTEPGA